MPKAMHWLILGTLLTIILFVISQPVPPEGSGATENWLIDFFFEQPPTPTAIASGFVLDVPTQHHTPPDQDDREWQAAQGTFDIKMSGTESVCNLNFVAKGLVPNGLYSLWWVDPAASHTSVRLLVFRANERGEIFVQLTRPANEEYEKFGVAAVYHNSSGSVGDTLGNLGADSFVQLASANIASLPMLTSTSTLS